MRRFHEEQDFREGEAVELSPQVAHHLGRVLRARPGDRVILFNGRGGEWEARVEEVARGRVAAVPLAFHAVDRMPSLGVTVALPLLKGERMDYALQKATELGAAGFRLVHTERTDVRLDERRLEKKMAHWRRVIISACEQCGRNRIPVLHDPALLDDFMNKGSLPAWFACVDGVALHEAMPACDESEMTILTGPEGGFSNAEREQAVTAGFVPVRLGRRTLRAETAPAAMLAGLQALRGEE